ncbi:MAG TPA: hypothetical protein VGM84_01005 [Steroidobacteraceae bacterium]|jgi:hypothetical protein
MAEFIVSGSRLTYGERNGADAFSGAPFTRAWEISADRIVCVGEATTESRESGEDWLLCVVTDVHGSWLEASLYSEGRNDALQWLSSALGRSFEVKLAHAPPFRSRVMWPASLEEQPLFDYQIPLVRRVFSRGLRRLGFPSKGAVQTVRRSVLERLRRPRLVSNM